MSVGAEYALPLPASGNKKDRMTAGEISVEISCPLEDKCRARTIDPRPFVHETGKRNAAGVGEAQAEAFVGLLRRWQQIGRLHRLNELSSSHQRRV